MAAAETLDARVREIIGGDTFHIPFAGLRRPLRHGKGGSGGRESLPLAGGPDVLVHPIDSLGLGNGRDTDKRNAQETREHRSTHKGDLV